MFAEWGSTKTGEQDGLIGTALNCVLQVPKFLPQEQRFDIRVLVRKTVLKMPLENVRLHVKNYLC